MLFYTTKSHNYSLTWVLMCWLIVITNYAGQADEVISTESVGVQDYLNKVCIGSASCHLIDNVPKSYRNLGVRNCMCDDQCPYYRDCCGDAPYKNSSRSEKATFECLETAVDGHVYVITSCSLSNSNSTGDLVKMCHTRDPELLAMDVLLSTPVTNPRTGRTYRNAFCALCNDDKEFEMWHIFVSYGGLLRALENGTRSVAIAASGVKSADDILNKIQPNDDYTWRFTNKNASLHNATCYLNATVPQSLSTVVRPCRSNVIMECASDWVDPAAEESVSQKCVDNDLGYVGVGDRTYRNKFCAECNHVSSTSATNCPGTRKPESSTTLYEPFVVNITDERVPKVPSSCTAFRQALPAHKVCPAPAAPPRKAKKAVCFPRRKDTGRPCLIASYFLRNDSELTFVDNELFVVYLNTKYKYDEEYFNGSTKEKIFICGTYIEDPNTFLSLLEDISIWLLTKMSIVCLLLHLLAFQQLPEMRNLFGKNLACFSLTLLICLVSFDLGPRVREWTGSCEEVGLVLHYTILSCFAWSLIMSYDCWLTLYRSIVKFRTSVGEQHSVTFAVYCLLSWVPPLIVVGYGAYLEYWLIDFEHCSMRPGYGLSPNCFIFNLNTFIYLLVVPASARYVGIILFFVHTVCMIYLSRRQTVNPNGTRKDFKLYTRLASMMGLTWTVGSIMTFVDSEIINMTFTLMNMSQGIFIFFGFTFRKKYVMLLRDKHSDNSVWTKILSTCAPNWK